MRSNVLAKTGPTARIACRGVDDALNGKQTQINWELKAFNYGPDMTTPEM